jgi:hypothetical protein
VTEVLARLDEPARQAIQETAEADLIRFHDDLDMTIRNELGLWTSNPRLLAACGTDDPDDASFVILRGVWQRLRGEANLLDHQLS